MLIPTGLKGKERKAYVKANTRSVTKVANKGPAAGLRPPGGDGAGLEEAARVAAEAFDIASGIADVAVRACEDAGEDVTQELISEMEATSKSAEDAEAAYEKAGRAYQAYLDKK